MPQPFLRLLRFFYPALGLKDREKDRERERERERRSTTIQIVVVHSHSGGKRVWDYLNRTHWNEFGTTKINITHQRDFNLDSLIKANPDIVICSDPAGAPYQYSEQEITDLYTFITSGVNRHLIGTYATFYHQEGPTDKPHIYDNRRLAALFGLDSELGYTTKKLNILNPRYEILPPYHDSILWRGVSSPYISEGYSSTQVPTTGTPQLLPTPWIDDNGQIRGAAENVVLLAKSLDDMCIITNYLTSNFSSIYISHMPEYESIKRDKEDLQLLYNSFIFLFNQGLANTSLVSLCTEAIAKQIGSSLVPSKMSLYDVPSDLLEKLYNELKLLGKLDSKTKTLFPCTLTASEE